MVRMNTTVPDDVGKELGRIKNKSRFIAQTLREKFTIERKKETEILLEKAYKKAASQDKSLVREKGNTLAFGF